MTGRVTLEPLSAAHLPGLERLWGDPAVIRYTNVPLPCTAPEAAERLERMLSCQAGLPAPVLFAVLEKGRFRGIAGCPPVDAARGRFGLFYQLLPAAWGRGIGLTAARLALEALTRNWPEASVQADVAAENAASVRILEGLGFTRTAERPGAFCRDGRMLTLWEYERRGREKR